MDGLYIDYPKSTNVFIELSLNMMVETDLWQKIMGMCAK
jgi:hypothetical protein